MIIKDPESLWENIVTGLVEHDYAITESFLSRKESAKLADLALSLYDKGEFSAAGIGNTNVKHRNEAIRSDFIFWLDDHMHHPAVEAFFKKVSSLKNYLNQTCYLGLNEMEFHLAVYPAGSDYKRHLDRFANDDSRVISLVLYLNRDWEEEMGGELVLYTNEGPLKVIPFGGRMVCFRSDIMEHEVLTSTNTRISLTGWLRRSHLV